MSAFIVFTNPVSIFISRIICQTTHRFRRQRPDAEDVDLHHLDEEGGDLHHLDEEGGD